VTNQPISGVLSPARKIQDAKPNTGFVHLGGSEPPKMDSTDRLCWVSIGPNQNKIRYKQNEHQFAKITLIESFYIQENDCTKHVLNKEGETLYQTKNVLPKAIHI